MDADEARALDREVEAAAAHQIGQDIGNPQPLPQAPEQQGPADPRTGDPPGLHVGECHRPLAVARQGGSRSSSPLASNTSLRPRARTICWRTPRARSMTYVVLLPISSQLTV